MLGRGQLMSLIDWFRLRDAPTPPQLNGPEYGPSSDSLDEHAPSSASSHEDGIADIEGVALALEYADAAGEISARRVIANRVSRATDTSIIYLEAWCLLRNDCRTFRSDRILKLTLPPAWSVVADPTAFLASFLSPRTPSTIERAVSSKSVCRDGLAVLLFVARSDGDKIPAAEFESIKKYIMAALSRSALSATPQVVDDIIRYAGTLYPTARSIGRYLERLEQDRGALEILVPHLTDLVKADGVYSQDEQEAVSALLKAIDRVRERIAQEESDGLELKAGKVSAQTAALGRFIALDLEKANSNPASICSVGLVFFEDGEDVKQVKISVNPESHFDPINISIHGIRPEDVASAHTIETVFPAISTALSGMIVVHHTHFDRTSLSMVSERLGAPPLSCRWLDSASVARRTWSKFSRRGYGLKNLAQEFGIEFSHHDACEDARAAGLILLQAVAATGLSLGEWCRRVSLQPSESESQSEREDDEGSTLEYSETLEASRISDLVAAVTLAKRKGRYADASDLLWQEIGRQEEESKQSGLGVAPWYYEQLAIIFRKQRMNYEELSILERYDRQVKAPGAKPAILKTRLQKVRARVIAITAT